MKSPQLSDAAPEIEAFLWPEQDPKLRQKRERILKAATDRFVRLGYRKTSVEDVAQHAGVAKGTVYLYYRNKAELAYHAIALEKLDFLRQLAPLADAAQSPRERLTAQLALGVLMSREMPLTTRLLQGDHDIELALRDMDQRVLNEMNDRQMGWLRQQLDDATGRTLTQDQLDTRVQVLMDLLFAVYTSNRANAQGMPWPAYARALAELLVEGVAHDAETTPALRRQGGQP